MVLQINLWGSSPRGSSESSGSAVKHEIDGMINLKMVNISKIDIYRYFISLKMVLKCRKMPMK